MTTATPPPEQQQFTEAQIEAIRELASEIFSRAKPMNELRAESIIWLSVQIMTCGVMFLRNRSYDQALTGLDMMVNAGIIATSTRTDGLVMYRICE